MKRYLYILLLITGCAGEGKYSEPIEDFLSEDEETLELIHHLDSVMINSAIELQHIDETIVAVENTAKREKKIKKELKKTQKELKIVKKELKVVKKELVSLQKIAGKRSLVKKILKIPVDSVEVSKVENKI